jgi:hypothetical protein
MTMEAHVFLIGSKKYIHVARLEEEVLLLLKVLCRPNQANTGLS